MIVNQIVAEPMKSCAGCKTHNTTACRVRNCLRCGELCWVTLASLRIIAATGAIVTCDKCAEKPDAILIVKESEFWTAIDEAKKHREARKRLLAFN